MRLPDERFWYDNSLWYNLNPSGLILTVFQDSNNTFYRPILFLTDNATRVSVEGITQLNSPCWTNFFVRTNDISFDNVFINAFSTNASVIVSDKIDMHVN